MGLGHDINIGQRTEDIKISEDITFETMLLKKNTLNGLTKSGFYKPSPIQLHGIPLGKCGFDLLLEAKSGTGKTAVFTVIALEKLDLNKGLQVVILAPTREIAAQIYDVITQIGSEHIGLSVAVVMGGLSVQDDIDKFKKRVHIVVGSPGRLKHLIYDNYIDVSSVRLLVIDECDKLMEKSFLPDVNYIFSVLPAQKQVIMSSATYPENCKEFINKYVQKAQNICPDSNSILLGISQYVTTVQCNNNIFKQTQYKLQELINILTKNQYKQCLIFCNYQARVTEVHKWLKKQKWPAELLYGQQDQVHRLDALKTLQEYKCRILISTDLAARGIDASNVDLVINFEPPFEWQTYLHRIGRAGRYGSYGIAVTILSEGTETNKFKATLKEMKIPIILKDLWSSVIFNSESSENSMIQNNLQVAKPVEKVNSEEYLKDLWNSIVIEEKSISEDIKSFDELNKSYKDDVLKEETFLDLCESFQGMQQSLRPDDVAYKCINFKNILLKDFFNNIENEDFTSDKKTQSLDNAQVEIHDKLYNDARQNVTELTNGCRSSNLITFDVETKLFDIQDIKLNKNITKSVKDNSEISNHDSNNYCSTKSETNVFHEIKKGFGEADIPISFGSKKQNKSNKTNKSRNTKLTDNSFNDVISDSESGYSESNMFTKQIRPNKHSKKENNLCYKKSKKQHSETKLGISAGNNSDNQTKYNIQSSLDYKDWYKQLKMRMKYVEYNLYIEEMSKF